MKPRTRARSLALQVLYEVDIANHPPGEMFKSGWRKLRLQMTSPISPGRSSLVFSHSQPISTRLIAKYAPEWPLDQIAAIDRNILRMALWEFAVFHETPIKVAINEAVELAKLYGFRFCAAFCQWCARRAGRPSARNPAGNFKGIVRYHHGNSRYRLHRTHLYRPHCPHRPWPKDMQKAGKTIGRWLNQLVQSDSWKVFQQTSSELRNLPRNLMREANMEECRRWKGSFAQCIDPRPIRPLLSQAAASPPSNEPR